MWQTYGQNGDNILGDVRRAVEDGVEVTTLLEQDLA